VFPGDVCTPLKRAVTSPSVAVAEAGPDDALSLPHTKASGGDGGVVVAVAVAVGGVVTGGADNGGADTVEVVGAPPVALGAALVDVEVGWLST
jgi:hypothetical protein